jgi:serine/threonine protein kinase
MKYHKTCLYKSGVNGLLYNTNDINVIAKQILMKDLNFEIQYLKNLNHPNIIKIYDVDEDKNIIYMERLKINLSEYIENYKYTIKEIISIFLKIIEGVIYLHKNNIVHLDLKCSNIMIDPNTLEVKIIDFGLSKKIESDFTTKVSLISYLTPEVVFEQDIPSYNFNKIDIWCLGLILYKLVTKSYLFDSENDKFNEHQDLCINNKYKEVYLKMLTYFIDYEDLFLDSLNPERLKEFNIWKINNVGITSYDGLKKDLFCKTILNIKDTYNIYDIIKYVLKIRYEDRPDIDSLKCLFLFRFRDYNNDNDNNKK